jgi:hypothetical protein
MEKKELFWETVSYLFGLVLVLIVYYWIEDIQEAIFVLVGLIYLKLSKLKDNK